RLSAHDVGPNPVRRHREWVVLSALCHEVLGTAPGSMSTTTSISSLQVHPTVLPTPLHMRYRNNLRNRIIRYLSMASQGSERPTYSMLLGNMLKNSSPVYAFATLILKNALTILFILFTTTKSLPSSRSTDI